MFWEKNNVRIYVRIRNNSYQKMLRVRSFMRKTTYTKIFLICVMVFEVFQGGLLFNLLVPEFGI